MVIDIGDGRVRYRKADQILSRSSVGSWEKKGKADAASSKGWARLIACILNAEQKD